MFIPESRVLIPKIVSDTGKMTNEWSKVLLFKFSAQDSDLADFFISRIEVSDLACTLSDNLG